MARAAIWLLATALLLGPARPAWARGRKAAKTQKVPPLTKDGWPNVMSRAAVVLELDSGAELYAKDPDAVRPIASVGKLFVALVVRDKQLPLDGKTTITEEDRTFARGSGKARSHLYVGRTFTNHDLLRAMLISSDNRAVTAVARGAGLSPDELVAALNAKARALGLARTRFTDPTGLNGNESTPREIAVALRAALADEVIAKVLATPTTVIESVDAKKVKVELVSTDRALRAGKRKILGGKTGYTDEARYCLAIGAELAGRRYGMVFLGAEGELTRFADFGRAAQWIEDGGPAKAGKAAAQK